LDIAVKKWRFNQLLLVYILMAAFMAISGIFKPEVWVWAVWENVFFWAGILGIVSIGQTAVILTNGIDLSIGAIMIFTIMLSCRLMVGLVERILPVSVFCLLLGAALGFINGLGVAKLKVPPILMTLATSTSVYGLTWLYGGAGGRGRIPMVANNFIMGNLLGIPVVAVFWIVLLILFIFLMHRTTFGRKVYSIGSNPRAASLSGVNVDKIITWVYAISGFLSALAGLFLAFFVVSASMQWVDDYTLPSIGAVILGGTSFVGGKGGIERTIIGVIFWRYLISLMTMVKTTYPLRLMLEGAIIIGLMIVYSGMRRD